MVDRERERANVEVMTDQAYQIMVMWGASNPLLIHPQHSYMLDSVSYLEVSVSMGMISSARDTNALLLILSKRAHKKN